MFATGVQKLVANYCISDFNRLTSKHSFQDCYRSTAGFQLSPSIKTYCQWAMRAGKSCAKTYVSSSHIRLQNFLESNTLDCSSDDEQEPKKHNQNCKSRPKTSASECRNSCSRESQTENRSNGKLSAGRGRRLY